MLVGWWDFCPRSMFLILWMLDSDKESYFTSETAWTQCEKNCS